MTVHSLVVTSPPLCCACGRLADDLAGTIPFYLPDRDIDTELWRCGDCGTYTRDIDLDDPAMKCHFDVASYTDANSEPRLRQIRSGYFVYLSQQLQKHLQRPLSSSRVLDVGTAYGHFLERLKADGALAEGVEIVTQLRKSATERGLVVHESIPIRPGLLFDAVTVIDSLYYTNNPLKSLQQIRGLLNPSGCLLLRVANRTWLLDLLRTIGIEIHHDRFGDAKYNFSPEGVVRLLTHAGFRVEELIWNEEGKADPRSLIRMYYRMSPLLCKYLSFHIAPGMLVVARSPN